MKESKLSDMSDKELMKEWTALGKEVQASKKRLTEFSQEHQKRNRFAQLNLEPGDLALLQGMDADGIESDERVNG